MEYLRDEFLDVMTFRSAGRPIFVELFGLLIGLEEEWRAQGASDEEISLRAFGFDTVRRHGIPANTGMVGGDPERIEEETAEYVISRDRYGRRVKLCKGRATIALPMSHPVTDMDSWLRIKPRYVYSPGRLAAGWAAGAKEARKNGALTIMGIPGGFDEPRQLMGEEALCLAYYEQPELIHDMVATFADTARKVAEQVLRDGVVDVLSVHEDMAGKSGCLIGPAQIADFVKPYFRGVWDLLQERGARLFQMDSDGNVNSVIPALLDCGLNSLLPMEPAAGMDIVQVRRTHGSKLAVMGGIDKHVLRRSQGEIRAELEYKLQPLMRQGGTIFGLDHRIPNGTPLENYRYYVRTAREILGLRPDPAPGWGRMAF